MVSVVSTVDMSMSLGLGYGSEVFGFGSGHLMSVCDVSVVQDVGDGDRSVVPEEKKTESVNLGGH